MDGSTSQYKDGSTRQYRSVRVAVSRIKLGRVQPKPAVEMIFTWSIVTWPRPP